MSNRDSHIDRFDDYCFGRMSEQELVKFQKELDVDADLRTSFETHKAFIGAIKSSSRDELKNELKVIHRSKPRELKVSSGAKNRRLRPWLAAASLLVLVFATWFFTASSNPQQLAASYYEPHSINVNLRNGEDQKLLSELSGLYINKEYKSVLPKIQTYLTQHPDNNNLRLALAISLFETDQIDPALQELNIIAEKGDEFLMDHVNWYKAIFKIKKGEVEQAIPILESLAADVDADHCKEAKALLRKLK